MGLTPGMISLAIGAIGATTAASINSGEQQRKAANTAGDRARENATKQAAEADRQTNAQMAKQPDVNALLSAAQDAAKGGASGTMLTGAGGVDPNSLKLGKTTLLGG